MYCSGNLIPSGLAADSYKKAVESAMEKLRKLEADACYGGDVSIVTEPPPYASFPFHFLPVSSFFSFFFFNLKNLNMLLFRLTNFFMVTLEWMDGTRS